MNINNTIDQAGVPLFRPHSRPIWVHVNLLFIQMTEINKDIEKVFDTFVVQPMLPTF
jgi:hypothetical protein